MTFWEKPQKLSYTPGQLERRGNKNLSVGDGLAFVGNNKFIPRTQKIGHGRLASLGANELSRSTHKKKTETS